MNKLILECRIVIIILNVIESAIKIPYIDLSKIPTTTIFYSFMMRFQGLTLCYIYNFHNNLIPFFQAFQSISVLLQTSIQLHTFLS